LDVVCVGDSPRLIPLQNYDPRDDGYKFLGCPIYHTNNYVLNVMDEVQSVEDSIHHISELLEKRVDAG